MTEQSNETSIVTSEIGKLLYGFSFTRFRLLEYSRFEGPPPLIFVWIVLNFKRTSKEVQKVILQLLLLLLLLLLLSLLLFLISVHHLLR